MKTVEEQLKEALEKVEALQEENQNLKFRIELARTNFDEINSGLDKAIEMAKAIK